MNKEIGDKNCPIWLLGDSNPGNWQDVLLTPLDPRHPARHSIWTPVLEVMQDRVFRKCRSRIDTSTIYIRNAIEDPAGKPSGVTLEWTAEVALELAGFQVLLERFHPPVLLCFGAFAFEFARRARGQGPAMPYKDWGAKTLGREFCRRIEAFDPASVNVLPLLHTSISRGRFVESHNYFTGQAGGNYFEFAGNAIADKLLQYRSELRIWIE